MLIGNTEVVQDWITLSDFKPSEIYLELLAHGKSLADKEMLYLGTAMGGNDIVCCNMEYEIDAIDSFSIEDFERYKLMQCKLLVADYHGAKLLHGNKKEYV